MTTDIYYFSGTGNSLYIARELQKMIPKTNLIPIVKLLDKDIVNTSAEKVGFVFPLHLMTLPIPVKKFIKKLDLSSTKYIFAIATRIGTIYMADIHIKKILKKKRKALDSFFVINMGNNSPCGVMPKFMPGFKKNVNNWLNEITEDKIKKIESIVNERLLMIKDIIINNEKYHEKESYMYYSWRNIIASLLKPAETNSNKVLIDCYSDPECTGCGICKEVCPSGKIKMIDNKPEWQKDVSCFLCYACFNFCPVQSVLIKDKYTIKEGRYIHPGITAKDIAGQK